MKIRVEFEPGESDLDVIEFTPRDIEAAEGDYHQEDCVIADAIDTLVKNTKCDVSEVLARFIEVYISENDVTDLLSLISEERQDLIMKEIGEVISERDSLPELPESSEETDTP